MMGLASCGSLEFESQAYRDAQADRSATANATPVSAPSGAPNTSGSSTASTGTPSTTGGSTSPTTTGASGTSGTTGTTGTTSATGTASTGATNGGTTAPTAPPIRQASTVYPKIYNTENRITGLRGTAVRAKFNSGRPPQPGDASTTPILTEGRMNLGRDWIDFGQSGASKPRHGATDETGVFSASDSEIVLNQSLGGPYDYASPYTRVYREGGEVYSSEGIVGIQTAVRDMPVTGEAIYYGEATARVASQGRLWYLDSGRSRASVDFGSGAMKVALYALKQTEPSSGDGPPLDRIIADNIVITGAGFRGGTVVLQNTDRTVVRIAGPGAISDVQGRFFGFDNSKGIPDELGGHILVQGPDGGVIGTFIAD